jgi:hypothetical protein
MKKYLPVFFVVALILAILSPTIVLANPLIWHNDQLINDSGKYAQYPDVALDGTNAVAVWYQEFGTNYRIYSNYSADGGDTWNTPQLIENNSGQDGYYPQVALSGSNAVVVWRQSDGNNFRIYSNYSTDGGASWGSSAQLIEDNAGKDAESPQVTLSGTTAVAVWGQWDGSAPRIYSNYSTDGGASWNSDQLIENNAGKFGYDPRVALSGSNVVAVWRQWDGSHDRIYSNYSTDGGATWDNDQLIDNALQDGFDPQVAVFGSNVVAIWRQANGIIGQIFSNYSTDGGITWNSPLRIENNDGQPGYVPQVALSGTNAVAVWRQFDGSNNRIYSNYSTDGGASWNSDQLIENNAGENAESPQLALSGSSVVAVWNQSDGSNRRIYSNYSLDGGASWNSAMLIENNSGEDGDYPQIALSTSHAVAVWTQTEDEVIQIFSNYADYESVPARAVGGDVAKVNELIILAPWLFLAVVLGAGVIILVFKRYSLK